MCCKQFITHIILVAAEGLWHLGSLFFTAHNIHKEGDLLIYFGVIFHETMRHAQAHVKSGAFIHCPFFGCKKHTDSTAFVWMISLASVCYGDSLFSGPTLGLTTKLWVG